MAHGLRVELSGFQDHLEQRLTPASLATGANELQTHMAVAREQRTIERGWHSRIKRSRKAYDARVDAGVHRQIVRVTDSARAQH